MEKQRSRLIPIVVGLAIAALFLYFTFHGIDVGAVARSIGAVSPAYTLALVLLSVGNVFCRGIRWWLLLPEPRGRRDLEAAQRALFLGYGINNVASRIGEIARLLIFKRDSGRSLGTITSTLVVDRILFDFVFTAFLIAYAVYGFRRQLDTLFPGLETGLVALWVVTGLGILGLLLLAFQPKWVIGPLHWLGMRRLRRLDNMVTSLVEQMSLGLIVLRRPGRATMITLFNILIWAMSWAYMHVAMVAMGFPVGLSYSLLLLAVSTLGVILPAPGGLGTTHFFLTTALTQIMAMEKTDAVAVATYAHGINYLAVSLAAVVVLIIGGRLVDGKALEKED